MAITNGDEMESSQSSPGKFTLGAVQHSANHNKKSATVIGPEAVITGDIKSSSDITIAGSINGEVVAEGRVTVAEGGVVTGSISANEVVIQGTVTGDLKAQVSLAILGTSEVRGDVTTPVITIEPGAVFVGRCNTTSTTKSLAA
jgi:cytoskeletal protein CcmA (bactofilin family)